MTLPVRYVRLMLTPLLLFVLFPLVRAQEGTLDKSDPKGITVEEIIKRFSAKEKEFKEARDQYTYRQDVKVQTIEGETPDGGEYKQVFDVSFDDKGRRVRNVVFAPQSTLVRIGMTQEDLDDIENRLPFVLTADEIGDYDILYVGQQKQDELNTYVFDIAPKQILVRSAILGTNLGRRPRFSDRQDLWKDCAGHQEEEKPGEPVPQIHYLARTG